MKASYFYAFLGQQHFLQATTKFEWFINPNAKKKKMKFRDAGMLKFSTSNMYIHVQIVGRSYKQNNWALRWMNFLIYQRNISLATYYFLLVHCSLRNFIRLLFYWPSKCEAGAIFTQKMRKNWLEESDNVKNILCYVNMIRRSIWTMKYGFQVVLFTYPLILF